MPVLLRERAVTARKDHACRTCSAQAIREGERYVRSTYVYDGAVYDWVQCVRCRELAGKVWDWSSQAEEGIGRDTYSEWAHEFAATDADARAWLERSGVSSC